MQTKRRSALIWAAPGAPPGLAGCGSTLSEQRADHLAAATQVQEGYKNGKYVLPDLPYDYDALQPVYDGKALRIHHNRLHRQDVDDLNATVKALERANTDSDYSRIKALSRSLAFHYNGHMLHTLFWNSMTPDGCHVPDKLASKMKDSFGSVNAAQAHFAEATKTVEGSGWGVLAYEPLSDKLLVMQSEKNQNPAAWEVTVLLACDVWEHAYYPNYDHDRESWVDNFMNVANWKFAAARIPCQEEWNG